MSAKPSNPVHVSERESLRVAEAAREAEWKAPSFLKELFLGNLELHLIRPLEGSLAERPEFTEYYERLRRLRQYGSTPIT